MSKQLSQLLVTLLLPLLLGSALLIASRAKAGGYDICQVGGCNYMTIQEAVSDELVLEGTTFTVAPETFLENVEITRSVSLQGAGAGLTIIDGQMTDTAVLISGGPTVSISNLTIRNGDASPNGGGVLNEAGQVTLTNVVVEENMASSGAGIANNDVMVLDNVTVRNNVADEIVANVSVCEDCAGGGIYNLSVMTITNSTIHDNSAQFGGGIENENLGMLSATNVEVYSNSAADNPTDPSAGGGIENLGTMTMTSSTIRNNDAPNGAGVSNGGVLTISNSDIYSNIADTRGGGFHNSFNLTVQTSNIYDNEAGSGGGGGISSESGDVVVAQTAVYNNSATGSGGGIVHNVTVGTNSFVVTNSTLSGNSTTGTGGGIRNAGIATTELNNVTINNNSSIVAPGQSVSVADGTVSVKNSIIIGTSLAGARTNCNGTLSSNGFNLVNDSSCGLSDTSDLVNANLLLGPLQDNGGSTLTHALLIGSPAIDTGNGCPGVDQRGVSRPIGAGCDRGAYEYDVANERVYLPFIIQP